MNANKKHKSGKCNKHNHSNMLKALLRLSNFSCSTQLTINPSLLALSPFPQTPVLSGNACLYYSYSRILLRKAKVYCQRVETIQVIGPADAMAQRPYDRMTRILE